MRAAFESQLMDSHIQNGFSLISLLTKLSSWEKKKRQKLSEPSTERHKAPLSVSSSLHPDHLLRGERLYNKQYSDFTRNVQLWLCRAGLVFLIAIHLNSSLWAYLLTYLRRCECPTKFYPTQHCNSLFWLYIQCMCACGYNITHIYTHTYMYGVFL